MPTPSLPLVSAHVLANADALHARFSSAVPFRHAIIDDFLDSAFARTLLAEFPAFERGNFRNEDGVDGGKSTVERIRGLGPAYAALDDCIRSRDFLDLVGRVTGIPDLLYDIDYFGGGTHENRDGQGLDNHIDFNYHPTTHWHRRLNLIVYLNPQWEDGWGGALELHRDPHDPDKDEIVAVTPLFNRCVIFETTEHSWHGFPRIELPARYRDLSRRSIALYFYTRERPAEQTARTHSTVYVDGRLPAHLQPGHVLTAQDCAQLHELLAGRANHNRRLYAEVERLQADLERTTLSRIGNIVRRRIARFRMRRASAG
jgi:hypothetical protein